MRKPICCCLLFLAVLPFGTAGPETPVQAKSGATLEPSTVTAISTPAVSAAPTAGSTYARLNEGDTPFSGAMQTAGSAESGNVSVKSLNGSFFANRYVGASPDLQWTAAFAACPSAGCYVEGSGFAASQTFTAGVSLPSKAVVVRLGPGIIQGPCPLFTITADGQRIEGVSGGDPSQLGATYGTTLKCTSGSKAIISIGSGSPRLSHVSVDRLNLNCNSVSGVNGLVIDTVQFSDFTNLDIANCPGAMIKKQVSNTGANVNNLKNHFANIHGQTGNGSIIDLEGNTTGGGNNTQEVYVNVSGAFTSNKGGVICNACDNETFIGLRSGRSSGSGFGLVFGAAKGAIAAAGYNLVNGYIGGVARISDIQAQTGTAGNKVYNHDRINGELAPTLVGSSELIVDGSVLCGPGGCPGASGIHPTPWIMAQGNAGNAPNSNPENLTAGCAFGWNYSNGGGEGDALCNIGGGNGAKGLFRWYSWNGSTATLYATLPNSAIGNIVGDTAAQTLENKTIKSPVVTAGVSADGSGFKHARFGFTCSTAASSGSSCTTTYPWPTAFLDANYTVSCIGVAPTGTPILSLNAVPVAASVTVNVIAATAVVSSFDAVDCVAVHD